MSTTPDPIQVFATAEQANITATATALTNIAAGIVALDALITAAGNMSLNAADAATLATIQAASTALVAQAQAISTAPPSATPTAPIPPSVPSV